MNITKNSEVVSVTIVLARDEALEALEDPTMLQEALREALDGVAPESVFPKAKRSTKRTTVRGAGRDSTITCSVCGKIVKPRGMGVHMARKHKLLGAPVVGD